MLKGEEKIEREPNVGKARAREALIGVLLEVLGFLSNSANWDIQMRRCSEMVFK